MTKKIVLIFILILTVSGCIDTHKINSVNVKKGFDKVDVFFAALREKAGKRFRDCFVGRRDMTSRNDIRVADSGFCYATHNVLPAKGEMLVSVAKLRKTLNEEVLVSTGVPFGVGQLKSEDEIVFLNEGGEIPIAVKALAYWHYDNSIRSVLVQFKLKWAGNEIFKRITMKWGEKRQAKDIPVTEIAWDIPESYIVLPAEWLCDSEIIGEHVPINKEYPSDYDKRILDTWQNLKDVEWTGDLRTEFYYDSAHTVYQVYVRTGEPEYFISARKEAIKYRDTSVIKEGPDRGSTEYGKARYVYVQALADDYLLTGDERSLKIAGYMAEHLKNKYDPRDAFCKKNAVRFWTEREYGAILTGLLAYYEISNDKTYLDLSSQYIENLYKTQMEWPGRGGFIHNLYYPDPDEGARKDECGGSPFMTGLILEPIIEYHKLTGSETAKKSILMALDWLINEALTTTGECFYYLTSDNYKKDPNNPFANLMVVHAFGYGYRLSGYKRVDYLDIGRKVFDKGTKDAFLKGRKFFNQNFRSSGHFLAYIKDGIKQAQENEASKNSLYFDNFEGFISRWYSPIKDTFEEKDGAVSYSGMSSIKVFTKTDDSSLSLAINLDVWNLEKFPMLSFAYKIPEGVPVGIAVKTMFDDWVLLGGTGEYKSGDYLVKNLYKLADDNQWHTISINVKDDMQKILPMVNSLKEFQFYTYKNAKKNDMFWVDEFRIGMD